MNQEVTQYQKNLTNTKGEILFTLNCLVVIATPIVISILSNKYPLYQSHMLILSDMLPLTISTIYYISTDVIHHCSWIKTFYIKMLKYTNFEIYWAAHYVSAKKSVCILLELYYKLPFIHFFISLDLLYFRLRSCNGFTPLCFVLIFNPVLITSCIS